jgi:hypothetical protein
MWKKYVRVRQATDDRIIRCIRFACWIPKAKNTHSEYVILIAFPRQKMGTQTCLNVTFICILPVLLCLKCLSSPSYSDNIATLFSSQTRTYHPYTVACKFGYTWMLLEGSSLISSVVTHSVCVLRKLNIQRPYRRVGEGERP